MIKLSKICSVVALSHICFLMYGVIFKAFNVNAAPLDSFKISKNTYGDPQFDYLCGTVTKLDANKMYERIENVQNVSINYNVSNVCQGLLYRLVRIQNFVCTKQECKDGIILNEYKSSMNKIFMHAIDFFYNKTTEIFKNFNNNTINHTESIKQVSHIVKDEIYGTNYYVRSVNDIIIEKDQVYKDTFRDFISEFKNRPSEVIKLNQSSIDGLYSFVKSLKNIFIHFVNHSLNLISGKTFDQKSLDSLKDQFSQMRKNINSYVDKENQFSLDELTEIYTAIRADKLKKAQESENSFIKLLLHSVNEIFNINGGIVPEPI